MSFYLPIYKFKAGDQLQFHAYFNAKFVNIDYPTRNKLFDGINQELQIKMKDSDYSIDALKLMYAHYSDTEYYIWNKNTQVSFEPKMSKPLAEALIANAPHFVIYVEPFATMPDIFWETP